MKVLVAVKRVVDFNVKVRVKADQSGVELANVIHAVSILQGVPVFIPRISFADKRPRHHGYSHHMKTLLTRLVLKTTVCPVPHFSDDRDVQLETQAIKHNLFRHHLPVYLPAPDMEVLHKLFDSYPGTLTTMGRSMEEDPSPFQAAYVAAKTACLLHEHIANTSIDFSPDVDVADILAKSWTFLTNDAN